MADFAGLLDSFGAAGGKFKKQSSAMGAGGGMGAPKTPQESKAAAAGHAFLVSKSAPIGMPSRSPAANMYASSPPRRPGAPLARAAGGSPQKTSGLGDLGGLLDGLSGLSPKPSAVPMRGSPSKGGAMRSSSSGAMARSPGRAGSGSGFDGLDGLTKAPASPSASGSDPFAMFGNGGAGATASAPTTATAVEGDDIFGLGSPSAAPTPSTARVIASASRNGLDDLLGMGGAGGASPPAAASSQAPVAAAGDGLDDLLGMSAAASAGQGGATARSNALDDLLGTSSEAPAAPHADGLDDLVAPAREATPAQPTPSASVGDGLDDLLGMSSGAGVPATAEPAAAQSADPAAGLEELLGGTGTPAAAVDAGDADLLGAFGNGDGGERAAATPTPAQDFASLDDLGGGGGAGGGAGGGGSCPIDDMLGIDAVSAGTGSAGDASTGTAAARTPSGPKKTAAVVVESVKIDPSTVEVECERSEDEPEERFLLRRARLQRVKARELEGLAHKKAVEAQEAQEAQERAMLNELVGADIDAWIDKNRNNVRGLLGSMHDVLWEGASWKAVSFADLIEPSKIKKAYRKAIIVVHPDKVIQRGADTQVRYVAGKVFDALQEAWKAFDEK